MPNFEFGPIIKDSGEPAETLVRTLGRVEGTPGVVTLEILQTIGEEGESFSESAVRWIVGLRMPPEAARQLANDLKIEAARAEKLS